jgi:hypothetical protein
VRPQLDLKNMIDSSYLPASRVSRRVRVKQSDFDALLEANYTRSKQPSGEVPSPVAPGETVEHEATPPDAAGDAGEA